MPETQKTIVAECYISTGVSKKTEKPYSVLNVKFENGYILEHFLTNEQLFICSALCPTV